MITIVAEFGRFRYNRLLMGMYISKGIFQYKLYVLLCYIKIVKIYINNIMVISKDKFHKHIYQLRIIFASLFSAGLKLNAPTCSFVLKYIPYIVYIITWEGIQLDTNKVKGIMYI